MKNKMNVWILLILPPLFFLVSIIICLIYFRANILSETQISLRITESIPLILFASQIGMLILLLSYSKKYQENIFDQTFRSAQMSKDIVWGILLGSAIAISYFQLGIIELITYLQNSFGDYVPVGETSNNVSNLSLLFFVSNVILAPFVEENIYRNVAFKRLRKQNNSIVTVIISALFFGLLHWLGGFWYIVTTTVLIGIPFGIIQLKRKSILLVFIAHLTLNSLEFVNSIYS